MSSHTRSPSLSPPPLKRRRFSISSSPSLPTNPLAVTLPPPHISPTPSSTLRILSWNINGITPFLPPVTLQNQRPITKFFAPTQTHCKASQAFNNTTPSKAPSLRRCLRRWGWPAVVTLQEVKIARADTATQDAVRRAVNPCTLSLSSGSDGEENDTEEENADSGPEYDVWFGLPRDKFNARGPGGNGRVYGVCMLVRRDVAQREGVRVREVEWDQEGRVLALEIPGASAGDGSKTGAGGGVDGVGAGQGSGGGLVVLGVYAVNGTTLPYRDPSTGTIMGDRHAHKRRFHTHLKDEVVRYEGDGWDIVVAGDLNVSRSSLDSYPSQRMGAEHVANRADFERKLMNARGGLGMVDSFREVKGQERKYTYRPPGRPWGAGMDRVDLILCSRGMGENESGKGMWNKQRKDRKWRLVDADILDTEKERGPSDHLPLYVDVSCAWESQKHELGERL